MMPTSTGSARASRREAHHLLEVGADPGDRLAAQRVVGAELDHHDGGLVALQVLGQAAQPAGGGLAGDARVHHVSTAGFAASMRSREEVHPALLEGEAVGGREAVAEHQHGARGEAGAASASASSDEARRRSQR